MCPDCSMFMVFLYLRMVGTVGLFQVFHFTLDTGIQTWYNITEMWGWVAWGKPQP